MFTPSMFPTKRDGTETVVLEKDRMNSERTVPHSPFKTDEPDEVSNNDLVGDEIRRLNS